MQIELYSFSKRKNSTKKPTSSGTVVSCVFKEETSVMTPSFELSSGSPIGYNYVKAWTNYYYITDCTFVTNGTWRISCRLDSLATYEATIKGMSAFIEYADTYDARIFDPRLAKKINATESSQVELVPFINPTGYCCIDILGKNNSGAFAVTSANARAIMQNVAQWWSDYENDHTWTDVVESIKNTGALLISGNAAANIKSCRFIPANLPGGSLTSIYVGLYDSNVSGLAISYGSKDTGSFSISVPHPSNVMLRTSQTCEYSLYIPFVGTVSLSADILADESTISIDYSLDQCTGDVAFSLETGSGKYIGTYGANIASDVPIGSTGIGVRNIATAAAAGVAIVASAGAAAVGASAAGTSAGAAAGAALTKAAPIAAAGLSQIQTTGNSVGGLGSNAGSGLSHYCKLTCSYWDVSDSGSSLTGLIGNPYYKVDTIGNHGYVVCSGASIDAIAYDDITNEINAYLRSGIYVE